MLKKEKRSQFQELVRRTRRGKSLGFGRDQARAELRRREEVMGALNRFGDTP
jgi:hypothetical protein